jgi:hypothetical protein
MTEGTTESQAIYDLWIGTSCPNCSIIFDTQLARNCHVRSFYPSDNNPICYACAGCPKQRLVFDKYSDFRQHQFYTH